MKLDLKLKGYDIFAIIAYCIVFILISAITRSQIVLVILGLPLFLILPGYLTMMVMYPERGKLALSERIALTLGLSFIIMPSLGLILNFTPFGIRLFPILISLLILVCLLGTLVLYLRRSIDYDKQFPPAFELKPSKLGITGAGGGTGAESIKPVQVMIIVIIVISLTGVFYMMFLLATTEQPTEEFTEMYILTGSGSMVEKPLQLDRNGTAQYRLNVINHEGSHQAYWLRIRSIQFTSQWELNETLSANDPGPDTPDNNIVYTYLNGFDDQLEFNNGTGYLYNFTLNNNGELEVMLDTKFTASGNYQFRIELFKDDGSTTPEPYLKLYFIVIVV